MAGGADVSLLENMPLFQGIELDCIKRLAAAATLRAYPPKTQLFEEGETPEALHIVLSGVAEAFTRIGEKECSILILSPSDAFMPASALVNEPYLLSARTMKRSKLLLLPADVVRDEMARSTKLACRLAHLLAGQTRVLLRHIKDVKTRSAPQRLAAYLLRIAEESESRNSEVLISKQTLASRLG
ncbi:cyclic nucleotide-binding domain-containing protein [Novosphingobium sp. RD2P27]|uniref:Cyclic nucleotide-binding domain-containing protein n=1 Tax=Novosphingobium kalidii TaxID=3230299 RepID=A0ABV2D248_9SPHN